MHQGKAKFPQFMAGQLDDTVVVQPHNNDIHDTSTLATDINISGKR
jgi:hypothetical protein